MNKQYLVCGAIISVFASLFYVYSAGRLVSVGSGFYNLQLFSLPIFVVGIGTMVAAAFFMRGKKQKVVQKRDVGNYVSSGWKVGKEIDDEKVVIQKKN